MIARIAARGGGLSFFEEILEAFGISPLDHAIARFVAHVLGDFWLGWPIIKIQRRFPYLQTADLLGGTFSPRDGYADPYLAATAIAARARERGASIRQHQEVVGFARSESRVTAVVTRDATIEAPVIVIAAGCWSGAVGRLAGAEIPVTPRRRHKFITAPFPADRIPEATPFVIDPHQGISIRREGAGLLLGIGRRDEGPTFRTETDWSLTDALVERTVHRAPALAEAALMRGWAGLYEMTPDRHPVIGQAPGVAGFYLANGFSGHGFQHAPVVGKLLAELILEGEAKTVDVSDLGLERFAQGGLVSEGHVV